MIKGETGFQKARFCLLKEMTLMKKAVTALGIACLAVFIFIQRAYAQMPVTLNYRHSVMKTPIEENLYVNNEVDGLVLKSTKYQSLGVGLPFLASDGQFRQEGPWFIMDNMNRKYPTLSLRNGVSNNGVIRVGNKSYTLTEYMPLGSELYVYVCPLYQGLFKEKTFR